MPKKPPLYPHVPKSRKGKPQLPEEELKRGTPVRMKSGTEGWVRGTVVEYFDVMPVVGGMIYTGPGYKIKVLEGKHKGSVLRLPANYVEPL